MQFLTPPTYQLSPDQRRVIVTALRIYLATLKVTGATPNSKSERETTKRLITMLVDRDEERY